MIEREPGLSSHTLMESKSIPSSGMVLSVTSNHVLAWPQLEAVPADMHEAVCGRAGGAQ